MPVELDASAHGAAGASAHGEGDASAHAAADASAVRTLLAPSGVHTKSHGVIREI